MIEEEESYDQEEARSARERWAMDEFTVAIAKGAHTEARDALISLLRYCGSTTDPNIARYHAVYMAKKEIAGKFERIEGKSAPGLP